MPVDDAEGLILRHFLRTQASPQHSEEAERCQEPVTVEAAPSSPCLSVHICGTRIALSKFQLLGVIVAVSCVLITAGVVGGVLAEQMSVSHGQSCTGSDYSGPDVVKDLPFVEDFKVLDPCTWSFDIGDGSDYGLPAWGNQELQCYTSAKDNVDIVANPDEPGDGILRIRQIYSAEPHSCNNRATAASASQWTSGKIHTKGKRVFRWQANSTGACTPIVVESRIKVPYKAGRWAAFWMMPQPKSGVFLLGCPAVYPADPDLTECGVYGSWPRSGEIDVMEQVNLDSSIMGTIHYANWGGEHGHNGGNTQLTTSVIQDWNVYKTVWGCDSIEWYVNNQQYFNITKQQLGAMWVFDQPFYLIINTAVGGILAGSVKPDTSLSEMLVDYVKVSYQK